MTNQGFNETDRLALFELLKDFVSLMTTEPSGKITYANEKFCELMGYKVEEVIGQYPRILKSGVHDSEFFKCLWETLLSGKSWHDQICNKKKDGSLIWLDTFIGPVFTEDGKIEKFILIRFDVTGEILNQQLIKNQERLLIFNSKMAALGEMAAGMAHEINNYLTVISAKTSAASRQIKTEHIDIEKLASDLEKAQNSVTRIAKIIEGLRRFSRNAEGDPMQAIPIQQILDDTLAMCHDKLKNQAIEFKVNFHIDSKTCVKGRSAQLSEVFINLVSNSIDAIQALDEKWIEIVVNRAENLMIIKVTDSGGGIQLEVSKKLMQPFFTTKEVGKGTGLGLSIVKKIVQDHQGKFYYNEKSPQTQFVIEIPLADSEVKKDTA